MFLGLVQHFYYPSSSELFELRCDLKSGDNRVPIRWLKNGQPFIVPVDRPVSLHENNHVIRFSSISPRDNGRYTCIAGDNLASVSSEIVVKRPGLCLHIFLKIMYKSLPIKFTFTGKKTCIINTYFLVLLIKISQKLSSPFS